MLHLTGYGLTANDLKQFRQWGSSTPGHPEVGSTPGVEVTTGPLGQGVANAVGMAIAERNLRARFGKKICDHYTYAICGDGDLSEGISHEAASLAGHLALDRLILIYDDNHITIVGPTELALSDNVQKRFDAYGWHVMDLGEAAEDLDAIERGIQTAQTETNRPSLIILRSHIATPSPDTDKPAAHGYSLKDEGIAETKRLIGIPEVESFHVPEDVLDMYREAGIQGSSSRKAWQSRIADWDDTDGNWKACWTGTGVVGWADAIPSWQPGEHVATRKASNVCIESLLDVVPGLIGGGADLTGNTGTTIKGHGIQSAECPEGRQVFFGVREHAMGAICNGMALHGGLLPIGGTFLVFSDYMRAAVRLAALSQAKSFFIWSHDSVGVGEDGPTHQPVEHAASLRTIPGLRVFRPADANEVAAAWEFAISADGPTAFLLTRQDVPVLAGTGDVKQVSRGAYVLMDSDELPEVILLGTGSEVNVVVKAATTLTEDGIHVRVVSMPSLDLFMQQDLTYRESVLLPDIPVVSVEAGVTFGWGEIADLAIGIDRFGASAPGDVVMKNLGITTENVVKGARDTIENYKKH